MSGEPSVPSEPSIDSAPESVSMTEEESKAISEIETNENLSKEIPHESSEKELPKTDIDQCEIKPGEDSSSVLQDNEVRLQQLEKEHETMRSQYMRIAADFDNFRKRQSRDQDDLKLQLTCSTLSEILPIVDNFERARQQLDPQGEEAKALHRSYQGLYKQLVDVLKQLGVAPMRVVGQQFDPTLHEAVLREPSNEQVEDIIVDELQRGYHLNGRVLRHALVKVSMGPGPVTSEDSNNQQNENPEEEKVAIEEDLSQKESENDA